MIRFNASHLALALLVAGTASACEEEPFVVTPSECSVDETRPCHCADGAAGQAPCTASGEFGACECPTFPEGPLPQARGAFQIAELAGHDLAALAVVGKQLYVADTTANAILVMPKQGGKRPETFAACERPGELATDGKRLVWSCLGKADAKDAAVIRVADFDDEGEASVADAATGESAPRELTVSGFDVYWAGGDGALRRWNAASGVESVAPAKSQAIRTEGEGVLFANEKTLLSGGGKPFASKKVLDLDFVPAAQATGLGARWFVTEDGASLRRVSLDGWSRDEVLSLPAVAKDAAPQVAVVGDLVLARLGRVIVRYNPFDEELVALSPSGGATAVTATFDDRHAYWIEAREGAGTVWRAPLSD